MSRFSVIDLHKRDTTPRAHCPLDSAAVQSPVGLTTGTHMNLDLTSLLSSGVRTRFFIGGEWVRSHNSRPQPLACPRPNRCCWKFLLQTKPISIARSRPRGSHLIQGIGHACPAVSARISSPANFGPKRRSRQHHDFAELFPVIDERRTTTRCGDFQ
jgi:hypothetical protein